MQITCFKAYDIRGRIPDQLNEDIAYRIGRAYATFLKPASVVVGYDIRLTSADLCDALTRGLTESGVVARTYELRTTNAPIAAMGWGAAHAVDLLYVFGNFDLPFARPDASERVVLAAMQGYWTRFAATGDPNGAGAVEWPRYDATEPVLVLDDPVTASAGLDQARCAAITP